MMESVRTGLRQIMQDLLRTRPADEAVILAWPLVCGKEVAARTTAAAFSDGTLTVEVSDVSWRNQLQSFAPRYLSGYEGLLGQVVKNVQFKVKQSVNQHSAFSTQHSAKIASSTSTTSSASTDQSNSTRLSAPSNQQGSQKIIKD
ncbi:MAG TPA: DUF721 domain-containing protein [Candidatus Angelobacter sp.]|jgi:hypothetical protein